MRTIAKVAVIFLVCGVCLAQDRGTDDRNLPSTFHQVNLEALTDLVHLKTGNTFLWGADVPLAQKTVNFKSDISLDDPEVLFRIYHHMLEVSGYVLVPQDGKGGVVYKIFPAQLGIKRPSPIIDKTENLQDQFVTRIFTLKYVSPREVHAALIQRASQPQGVFPLESAGILMVTDYDYNVARFEEIIRMMDVKKPDIEMRVIQLKNALASDLEQMLAGIARTMVQRQGAGGRVVAAGQGAHETVEIMADRRTNSLVVLAEPHRLEQLIELIARLDSEAGFETSGIYFFRLRHTNAPDIAKTLNAMYGVSTDEQGVPSAGAVAQRPGQRTGPAGTPSSPISTSIRGSSSSYGSSMEAVPTIVADIRSNSLIVITDRNTYRSLERVVKRLDQRRPQVHIKATVVEVSTTNEFDFGIELNRLVNPEDRIVGIGRQNFGYSALIPNPVTKEFEVTPVDSKGITLALLKDRIGNIGAMVKALGTDVKVDILDEPEAATVDNGMAEMKLVSQVPVLQTIITGTGISQTTFNRFEEAETTLSISPHISEGNYLRLDVTVKIEKFTGTTLDPTIPPPKASREITTNSVLVPNARTVVIGGIVTHDDNKTINETPWLADIPLLGWLFQRETTRQERRTLYIFITPYIMFDDAFGDFREVTKRRKEAIEILRGKDIEDITLRAPAEPGVQSLFEFPYRRKEE